MDISTNISANMYTDYLNSNIQSTANNVSNMSKTDMSSKTDDELFEACKEFETYFTEQVFKEMLKSVNFVDTNDAASSTLIDYYKDELTTEYSKLAASQSKNGLAAMLYEQMKRNYAIDPVSIDAGTTDTDIASADSASVNKVADSSAALDNSQ